MIWSFINTKGGVGKTTTAWNTAIGLAQMGASVLLVDTDYQQTLSKFAGIRKVAGRAPLLRCKVMEGKIGVELVQAQKDYDFIIVDAGGRDSLELRQALAASDKIVIPIRPAFADVMELLTMNSIMAEIEDAVDRRLSASVLVNSVKTGSDKERSLAYIAERFPQEVVERLPIMSTSIWNRVAFDNSIWSGEGVTEEGASFDNKASSEIKQLIKELLNEPFSLS